MQLELSSELELDKPPAEFPGRQLMRVLREAVGVSGQLPEVCVGGRSMN